MTTQTLEHIEAPPVDVDDAGGDQATDPFDFDIRFVEGVDASETVLMCGTGDNCGSSCGSACVTS